MATRKTHKKQDEVTDTDTVEVSDLTETPSVEVSTPIQEDTNPGKKVTVITTVQMDDGSIREFPGKRMILTETITDENGNPGVKFYLISGKTLVYVPSPEMMIMLALHGAKQKICDSAAGLPSVEDKEYALEETIDLLNAGKWVQPTQAKTEVGGGLLYQALCEVYPSKTPAALREFLRGCTDTQKKALRIHESIAPVLERLKLEKMKKKSENSDEGNTLLEQLAQLS